VSAAVAVSSDSALATKAKARPAPRSDQSSSRSQLASVGQVMASAGLSGTLMYFICSRRRPAAAIATRTPNKGAGKNQSFLGASVAHPTMARIVSRPTPAAA